MKQFIDTREILVNVDTNRGGASKLSETSFRYFRKYDMEKDKFSIEAYL